MGDDACWLDRTCLSCGRFLDLDDTDDGRCPHCGAELPPSADDPLGAGDGPRGNGPA